MGRRTLLTPEKHKFIVSALAEGVHRLVACRAASVTPDSFYRWVRKGERDANAKEAERRDSNYAHFFADVSRATALCEVKLVDILFNAVKEGDVETAKWMLLHRFESRWAAKQLPQRVADDGADTRPVQFVLAVPTLQQSEDDRGLVDDAPVAEERVVLRLPAPDGEA